jgi:hypothetical protein
LVRLSEQMLVLASLLLHEGELEGAEVLLDGAVAVAVAVAEASEWGNSFDLFRFADTSINSHMPTLFLSSPND